MRSLSKSFKKELNNDNRRYLEWVDITLKDGTALYLREDSVWNFGLKVEDAVSDSSEFKIGSAIINKATVTLNNIYDDFTDYDFEGAEIAIYVGLAISPTGMVFPEEKKWLDISENPILDTNGNEILLLYSDAVTEKIRLCTMTVVEAPYQNSSIITLTCQDNMMKFDRDYSESKLKYPATRSEIIRDACNVCGVQLQTVTFDNDDYVIETRPDDQQLTFRQVLAWVAQIGGQFCRCDSYGRLCIAWYDLKSYESSHIDEDKFVSVESYDSLSINNEDVVITGIKVTEYKENVSTDESPVSYQYGEDGYVIEIKDNKLIAEGKGNDIATIIGKRIVGMRFRPFSASMMNNPLAEAGDICIITDRKGNQYKSLVTSTIFQVGNKQTIECGAKSAARNSAKQYSLASQAIVENRKNLQKERSDREKALEELSKRIRQSSGLYTTVVESSGGGKVYYLHDKALLSDSDIVWKMTAEAWGVSTDGGQTWNGGMTVDGDTVVRILDAVGVRANWINTGEFKVADEKGNEVFYVNCDTGSVRIKAQEFSLSGVSIEEIAAKKVDDFVTNIYKTDMDEIKNSVRNKIETWYQSTDPSVNWGGTVEKALCDIDGNSILDVNGNEIIVLFEESKSEHEGDLWKDLSTNDEYIYRGGHWVKMQVPDEVFDEIDGKAQIFINTPVPPYRVGDLWFDADTQELLTCVESRDKGSCVKSDWQKKTKYTDDSGLNTFISAVYDPKIAELQSQIDGQIETWFYDHEPSLQNEPAVNWTTNEQRKDHEGDLFFWKSTGYSYRFLQDGAVWKWQIVQDTDISKALAAAEKAQDTADHKRRVFVVTPQPPYDIGDLWVQGDDGDIMRCCVARSESASFSASDWEKASKYTDDTRANEVQKELETVNKDLQNQIDGKIETYNQSADPAASWTTAELKAKHTGDLWYNSKTEETMRWNGSAWSKLSDADAKAAKNLAVTKKRVFSVTPYPPYDTDDLWVQGTNGDLMRCVTSRQSGEYVASDWVKATKYTDDSAINNFVKNTYAADLENIKNQIDQKIETWFQPTDPSLNWTGKETQPLCDINGNEILDVSGKNITITVETEKATHEGDLWKNSKTGDEYIYRSGNWEEMPVPDSVFDEIDGKAQIFSTQPKPPYSVDDLYFTGNDILVCLKDRETGEYVASDWQKKDNYTDDSTVTDFIENIYDPKIEDIQNQIDGKIDTYYYDYEPANSNHPASEWTTAYERQKHVGDLFFWKNKGFTYRYMKVDTSYQWVRVKDADIVSAMETASKAQDTADGKRRNFITTPVPPYDVGDLWTQGDTGDLMRCQTARASGNYVSSDWTKATKYTDDSAVEKLNKSLTSEEVFNRLTDNGKKQGIYMQGDQLYINFSYGKGGTLTLGGVNNENGSIQILDAIGAEVGKWDKDGLNIQKGSIYGSTIYLDKEKAYALIVGRNNSKEIFTIGSMGMHIDNTNMGLLASDSMVVDLMGGWFHGLRMKASNNGRGYGSSISPECFSIGWAEDLQGWSDAMSTVKSYTFSISENSTGCLSIRINGSSYINDYVDISPREIKTTGTKNRVVPTENYSNRLQYCYETASPMFGDIGEGITDENGECIVEIGDIFTETVTTRIEYQVFLQKEGKGDLWIEKKEENYFIVHGTPNLKFAWELKAKQKDYEYVNLEEDVDREEKLPESPENILNAELETLIKEQEELLNETA